MSEPTTQDNKFIGTSGDFNVKKLKSEVLAVIKPEFTKNGIEVSSPIAVKPEETV